MAKSGFVHCIGDVQNQVSVKSLDQSVQSRWPSKVDAQLSTVASSNRVPGTWVEGPEGRPRVPFIVFDSTKVTIVADIELKSYLSLDMPRLLPLESTSE